MKNSPRPYSTNEENVKSKLNMIYSPEDGPCACNHSFFTLVVAHWPRNGVRFYFILPPFVNTHSTISTCNV